MLSVGSPNYLKNSILGRQNIPPIILDNLYDTRCRRREETNDFNGGVKELNEVICRDRQAVEELPERAPELPPVEANDITSPTLARLIEEVRNEEANSAHMYNRMHNRHNRSR